LVDQTAILREASGGLHGLLEVGRRLDIRRPGQGLQARLPEISKRLFPHFSAKCMMGEAIDPLNEAVGIQSLDTLGDACVEPSTPVVDEAAIGNLMGQRVLERVFEIREESRFIEQLGALKPGEPAPEVVVREAGDRLKQSEGYILANHRRGLQ